MELPPVRFPGYFREGLADRGAPGVSSVLGWGQHGGVLEGGKDPNKGDGHFIPLYSRRREHWSPENSVPSPLLPPNYGCSVPPLLESDLVYKKLIRDRHTNPRTAGVTINFSKQLSHFCWDHNSIAFHCMSRLLDPHCHVGDPLLLGKIRQHCVRMTGLMENLKTVPLQDCPFCHSSYAVRSFSYFTQDWLHDIPPQMLAELLSEGMAEDWKDLQFQACLTGGALCWVPYAGTRHGCLIYPQGAAMNLLHFQQCLLDPSDGLGVRLKRDPAVYDLKERILQVSAGEGERVSLGVRSAHHLAAWSFSCHNRPKLMRALRTRTPSTCITASPHMAAEFCVCMESGSLYLWDLESGLRRVRQDAENLVFRDDPSWRWSDFTSHPRVLTLADRTGVQLVDIRAPNSEGRSLFHIGQESSSWSGERVILQRCQRETNPAHCLVTTQFSLYIMDERFPLVPVVRWDHMMADPPTYVCAIPGDSPDRFNKILLGTQYSQETLMVQYSGGASSSCQLHLPAIYVPRLSESLHHLPPLLPHHQDMVLPRLQSPLAGLAAASLRSDRVLAFQLTAAGDLFVQRLSRKKTASADTGCDPTAVRESCVSDSTPEEPAVGHSHQAVPGDEAVRCSSGSGHQTAQSSRLCRWLHKVCSASPPREAIARPRCQIYRAFIPTKMSDSSEEVCGLREHLRDTMRKGAVIQLPALPTSHRLEAVDPKPWRDSTSRRLTASWEGKLGLWWDDHLGLNKDSKIRALRERRRRQKLLRSPRSNLSSSFTSATGSDFDDMEPTSPWSGDSGPDDIADHPPAPPMVQESARESSQVMPTSRLSQSASAIISSQSLRAKGIPHERRQTLRDFLFYIKGNGTTEPETAPSLAGSQSLHHSQFPSQSQRSQPPKKKSRMGF